jgi:DNA-directed RNA polymerase specialized sigma24 family protein
VRADADSCGDQSALLIGYRGWPVRPKREVDSSGDARCQKSDLARQIGSVSVDSGSVLRPTTPAPLPSYSVRNLPTRELLDAVVEAAYVGEAWRELQRRLVERALPDLERAISAGTIYGRCVRAGFRIKRRDELQRHPHPEEIAAEAVEECLMRFRTSVLPTGEWDPRRGISLEDFFCSCCLSDVANRWRWHLRRLPDRMVPLGELDESAEPRLLAFPLGPTSDPAEVIEIRDLVAQAMRPLSQDDRATFVLLADGWSPEEIARMHGINRNTLDARISRARKASRLRRTL